MSLLIASKVENITKDPHNIYSQKEYLVTFEREVVVGDSTPLGEDILAPLKLKERLKNLYCIVNDVSVFDVSDSWEVEIGAWLNSYEFVITDIENLSGKQKYVVRVQLY